MAKTALGHGQDKRGHARPPACHPDEEYHARDLCKPCYKREKARRYRSDPGRAHGLPPGAFAAMVKEGGGRCDICRRVEVAGRTNLSGRLFIDHDHDCCPGKFSCGRCVRGLLCSNCNFILGHAGDDKRVLRRAIAYLGKGGK
jgi:hypothetical protein